MVTQDDDHQDTITHKDVGAEQVLVDYLNDTKVDPDWQRVHCCGCSQYFYCVKCYRLLIPQEGWCRSAENALPFHVDILLDVKERKGSSSGVQLHVLNKAIREYEEKHNATTSSKNAEVAAGTTSEFVTPTVRLFDLEESMELPHYSDDCNDDGAGPTTFVLFPSPDSRPITEVASRIRRLVVLDCKWTRTAPLQAHPSLQDLPRVHLSTVPEDSYFWRWHRSGRGMVSTLEAVYYAAHDVTHALARQRKKNIMTASIDDQQTAQEALESTRTLVRSLMWLFSLQRQWIAVKSQKEARPAPFTQEGKSIQRQYREPK